MAASTLDKRGCYVRRMTYKTYLQITSHLLLEWLSERTSRPEALSEDFPIPALPLVHIANKWHCLTHCFCRCKVTTNRRGLLSIHIIFHGKIKEHIFFIVFVHFYHLGLQVAMNTFCALVNDKKKNFCIMNHVRMCNFWWQHRDLRCLFMYVLPALGYTRF